MACTTPLTRGALYTWAWPTQGAGAMALRRGLRPVGRAVTREDITEMSSRIESVGIQLLDDSKWIVGVEMNGIAPASLREMSEA